MREYIHHSDVKLLKERYEARKGVLTTYLDLKRDEWDLHGIEDCASDLRDVEAAIQALDELLK